MNDLAEKGAGPNAVVPSPPRQVLSNQERAAVILALLEPQSAHRIASEFDEGLIDKAVDRFRNLRLVPPRELILAIEQFNNALETDLPVVAGGAKRADALACTLAPPENENLEALPEPEDKGSIDDGADAEAVWSYVSRLSPSETVRLLQNERASIIAAVARRIPRANAAAVLDAIPEERASRAIRLLLGDKTPTERTYDAVAESLRRQVPSRLAANLTDAAKDVRKTADILNAIPARRQDTILTKIASDDPQTAERLEKFVLKFVNLQDRLPKTIIPTLFREVDDQLLDQAIGYAMRTAPETAEFLLGCISQRLAEMIRDRIEEKPAVRDSDGEAAQTEIMQVLIGWSEADRFAFKLPPEEEDTTPSA